MAEKKTTTRKKKSDISVADESVVLEKAPKAKAKKAAEGEAAPKKATASKAKKAAETETAPKKAPAKAKKTQTFGVYFKKPAHWGTPAYVYYWNVKPSGVLEEISWPGVEMQYDGNDWYKFDLKSVNAANIIFHDNSGDANKTGDLYRESSGWFVDGVWHDNDPR